MMRWGRRKPPTPVNGAEVFDSEGTLALMVNGRDVAHLMWVNDDLITREQRQQVIDAIVDSLAVPR
jgi:hypothetical protein